MGRLLFSAAHRQGAHAQQGMSSGTAASVRRCLAYLMLIAIVGGIVMSPVYLGYFTEAAGHSTRVQSGGWTRELAVSSNSLDPTALATSASPWLARIQIHEATHLWDDLDVSSCSTYVGILILLFALFGLLSRPTDGWRWWLAAMTALMLMIAVGERLPLRGWLYDLLPPFRYFRHASMFRGYAIFFLCVLAMTGLRDLVIPLGNAPRTRRWLLVAAAGLNAALAVWAFRTIAAQVGADRLPEYDLASLHLSLWFLPILVLLPWVHSRWRSLATGGLILLAALDAFSAAHLSRFTIVDESPTARANRQKLDTWHTASLDIVANARPRVMQFGEGLHNNNVPVKLPTLVNNTALSSTYLDRIAGSAPLAALATGWERWWFAPTALHVPLSEDIVGAIVSRAEHGEGVPLVVHTSPAGTAGADASHVGAVVEPIRNAPRLHSAEVELHHYTPTRLELSVKSDTTGWLLVTDRWSPGWKATLNGRHTPVHQAIGIFRAVEIGKGTNVVDFKYRPRGLPAFLTASWLFLAVAATSVLFRRFQHHDASGATVELTTTDAVTITDDAKSVPDLSIVIPCYDAEAHIGGTLITLVKHIDRRRWNAEIVIVDDGSRDRTVARAKAVNSALVRLLRHQRNMGKGMALRTGLRAARGHKRLFTDCDLPYGVEGLAAVAAALDETDIAVGMRLPRSRSRSKDDRPLRVLSSRTFSGLVARLFDLPTHDTQCGVKGFTATALELVLDRSGVRGFAFDVEALVIARRLGLRVRTVPVTLRRSRGSSVQVLRHSIQMIGELARIRINDIVGRYR
jgi:hypothetical protein